MLLLIMGNQAQEASRTPKLLLFMRSGILSKKSSPIISKYHAKFCTFRKTNSLMSTEHLHQAEFFGLMMLYAASIDGETHDNELIVIKDYLSSEQYERVTKLYSDMSDYELINFFRDNKKHYIKSTADEKIFLSEIKTVLSADHNVDVMEKMLMMAFKKIIRE